MTVATQQQDSNRSGRRNAGDDVISVFTVTNTGDVRVTRLALVDQSGRHSTCVRTTLPAHSATSCRTIREVAQADMDRGSVTVGGRATARTDDGRTPSNTSTTLTVSLPQRASLAASQLAVATSPRPGGTVAAGDLLTYRLRVVNSGTVTITRLTIADRVIARSGAGDLHPDPTVPRRVDHVPVVLVHRHPHTGTARRRRELHDGLGADPRRRCRYERRHGDQARRRAPRGREACPRGERNQAGADPRARRARQAAPRWLCSTGSQLSMTATTTECSTPPTRSSTASASPIPALSSSITWQCMTHGSPRRTGDPVPCLPHSTGAELVCSADAWVVTPFQAKHGIGRNYAFATAVTANARPVRSAMSVSVHGRAAAPDVTAPAAELAMTGMATAPLLLEAGMLLAFGGWLCALNPRRQRAVTPVSS